MKLKIKLPLIITSITLSLFLTFSFILFELYRSEGLAVLKNNIHYELKTQASEVNYIFSKLTTSLTSVGDSLNVEYVNEDLRREYIIKNLITLFENNENISSVWFMSKSNDLDSFDSEYANTTLGNENGQFNPILFKEDGLFNIIQMGASEYEAEFYVKPIATQKLYITNPFFYSYSDNINIFMISICYPISDSMVIGFDLAIDDIVNTIASYKPFDVGYTFLLTGQGIFISHPAKTIIGKRIDEVDPTYNERYNVLNKIKNSENIFFEKIATATGTISYTVMIPFTISEMNDWYIAFSVPLTIIKDKMQAVLGIMLIFLLLASTLLSTIIYLITRSLVKKITTLSKAFEQISTGSGDLTRKINTTSKDELGDIANSFNSFLTNLAKIITDTKQTQEELFKESNSLSALAEELAASTNQINITMSGVERTTIEQVTSANESNATILEIGKNIQKLNEKIQMQKDSIGNSTANIEEMISNITSISNMIKEVNKKFFELAQKTDISESQLEKTLKKIEEILTLSTTLNEANTMIKNIAARTSILAINAGIESAHAGDYGQGFKVIAEEVRKLADDATKQSKVISTNIKEIQKDIVEVKSLSGKVKESFGLTIQTLQETTTLENEANASMEEQGLASKNVLESLSKVNNLTNEILDSFKEIVNSSTEISKEMTNIITTSSMVENSIKEVSIGINEINKSAQMVSDSSNTSKLNATRLKDNVDKFVI